MPKKRFNNLRQNRHSFSTADSTLRVFLGADGVAEVVGARDLFAGWRRGVAPLVVFRRDGLRFGGDDGGLLSLVYYKY